MILKSKYKGQKLNSKNRKKHKTNRNALNLSSANDNVNNRSEHRICKSQGVEEAKPKKFYEISYSYPVYNRARY